MDEGRESWERKVYRKIYATRKQREYRQGRGLMMREAKRLKRQEEIE